MTWAVLLFGLALQARGRRLRQTRITTRASPYGEAQTALRTFW